MTYRHYGTEHRATVRGDHLVLDDGREFVSPTAAAKAVNGGVSVNGWRVWSRDGISHADLVDRRLR